MSEYVDRLAVDRLIGGSLASKGLLTAKIREQPFSVVLLDELEKAHQSFFDLLLQVLHRHPRVYRDQLRLFNVNYFCRLASTIFAGSARRGSRSTTVMPVGRVGGACAVRSGVESAPPRR